MEGKLFFIATHAVKVFLFWYVKWLGPWVFGRAWERNTTLPFPPLKSSKITWDQLSAILDIKGKSQL